jgi:hypothetical protein
LKILRTTKKLAKKREDVPRFKIFCIFEKLKIARRPSQIARFFANFQSVIAQCKKPAAHSSTFGFLPTHKAQTKKPKELEFFPTHRRQKYKINRTFDELVQTNTTR